MHKPNRPPPPCGPPGNGVVPRTGYDPGWPCGLERKKAPTRSLEGAFLIITSLTITYFHTGCSTIIGAELFHGPVRDGKGWDQLAMVIRH